MADVSAFINMMPPMKGERIEPVLWDAGMTKACAGVLENPKENVLAIIALFADADDGKDYKARYLLRGVISVAADPDNKQTKLEPVVDAIGSQLSGDRNKEVKAALLRELKFAGTPAVVKAIAPLAADEQLCADACDALCAIGTGATAALVGVLPNAKGKARTEIVHALAALGEAQGLAALQGALADAQLDTRIEAAWGVARCGDATSVDALLKTSAAAKDWERIQLTDACLIMAETLTAAGKKGDATKIYNNIIETRTDPKEAYLVAVSKKALTA